MRAHSTLSSAQPGNVWLIDCCRTPFMGSPLPLPCTTGCCLRAMCLIQFSFFANVAPKWTQLLLLASLMYVLTGAESGALSVGAHTSPSLKTNHRQLICQTVWHEALAEETYPTRSHPLPIAPGRRPSLS